MAASTESHRQILTRMNSTANSASLFAESLRANWAQVVEPVEFSPMDDDELSSACGSAPE